MRSRSTFVFLVALYSAVLLVGISTAYASVEPIPYTSYPTSPISNYDVLPYKATGKMLFTLDGVGQFCTATYISSNNSATIATAAHCLKDIGPGGAWAQNVVFIPGQDGCDQCRPFGTFPMTFGAVEGPYASTTSYNYDAGFFKVGLNSSNQTISQAVGYSDGYEFNYSDRNEQLQVMGLPGGPWGGFQLMNCASNYGGTFNRGAGPLSTLVGCDWNSGGFSGGPMMKKFSFNFASFTNQLMGVLSAYFPPGNEEIIATYWGQDAFNAFNAAQNA